MRTAAVFLIAGSVVFGLGASIGVPQVFMLTEAQARLDLLQKRMWHWRLAQPLYALGPLIAALGVVLLAVSAHDGTAMVLCVLAGSLMLAGVGAWAVDCYLRGTRPADFAFGRLPGWPFVVYVLATIFGLALVAGGLAAAHNSGWLYWSVVAADMGFLAFYLVTRDLPPFFFYTLLLAMGIVLVADPGA